MARIAAVATASPPHTVSQREAREWLRRLYGDSPDLPAMLRVMRNSGIEERHFAVPAKRMIARRSFADRHADYLAAALPLVDTATRGVLDRAGLLPIQVDLWVTASCTGVALPSLSARLAPRLGMRPDVVRLPITELGCGAGAAAVARAADYLVAYPTRVALVTACELSSTSFQPGDGGRTNMVSASLFGDGAAAVALLGSRAPVPAAPGPRVVETATCLWPDSTHMMGFDAGLDGFHIVLDAEVPAFLRGRVRPAVESLCDRARIRARELSFFVIHPGGKRILSTLEEDLATPSGALYASWEVLKHHGNMSSASVLFVLGELLAAAPPPPGSWGLMAGFGPGLFAELLLLRWER